MSRLPALTEAQLTKAAIEMYLADGEDHTAAEMAAHLGYSAAAIRRVLDSASGCPAALRCDQVSRESHIRSCPGTPSGSHRVWVYGPRRETLRKKICGEWCDSCQIPLSSVGCGCGARS